MVEPEAGLLGSLRRLAASLVEMAQMRLEFIGTEIEAEKLRLAAALMWAGIAAVLFGVGLLMVTMLVVLLFWDHHRVVALAVERGVEVSEVQDFPWGKFVFFSDPDGNGWALQQL